MKRYFAVGFLVLGFCLTFTARAEDPGAGPDNPFFSVPAGTLIEKTVSVECSAANAVQAAISGTIYVGPASPSAGPPGTLDLTRNAAGILKVSFPQVPTLAATSVPAVAVGTAWLDSRGNAYQAFYLSVASQTGPGSLLELDLYNGRPSNISYHPSATGPVQSFATNCTVRTLAR